MGFPVFKEHLDQPPQGAGLGDVQGTPSQIGSHEIAVLPLVVIFQGQDKALFAVTVYVQAGTAQIYWDWLPAAATKRLRDPREALKIGRYRTRVPAIAHPLVMTQLADDLHPIQ